MDMHMNYGDVDSAVAAFQKGVESLTQVSANLRKIIDSYQGGGFQGQSGEKYVALLERKIQLVDKLRNTYQQAIAKLREATQTMQDTDSQLRSRVQSI